MVHETPTPTAAEVAERRQALGWSQNELARRIGKTPGYLSRVLAGTVVSAPVWRRIDIVLSRTERRLLAAKNGPPPEPTRRIRIVGAR